MALTLGFFSGACLRADSAAVTPRYTLSSDFAARRALLVLGRAGRWAGALSAGLGLVTAVL